MKIDWIKESKNLIMVTIANAFLAFSFVMFILPLQIISGGMGGIGVILHNLFGIEPTTVIFILAWSLFALGWLAMGLGFTGALTLIGLIREFLGAGTLFAQASNLLGPSFAFLEMKVPGYDGALLMILPPGGFAILGFLLAGKRVLETRATAKPQVGTETVAA